MEKTLARKIARFNKRFTNRITGPLAPHLPGFGVIAHIGRTSGRRYETPINVFRRGDGFVIALTYGRESDWVKNVLASGGCELVTRGQHYRLDDPQIVHDESCALVSAIARPILHLVGVADFMILHIAA